MMCWPGLQIDALCAQAPEGDIPHPAGVRLAGHALRAQVRDASHAMPAMSRAWRAGPCRPPPPHTAHQALGPLASDEQPIGRAAHLGGDTTGAVGGNRLRHRLTSLTDLLVISRLGLRSERAAGGPQPPADAGTGLGG